MHVGHVCRNLTAKEEIEKHRRNRQQQAATRCDERFSDPLGQVGRFGLACCQRAEACNHPRDRAQQPNHGREHGERVQVIHDHHHFRLGAKAIVSDGIFHRRLVEHVTFVVRFRKGGGERMGKRRRDWPGNIRRQPQGLVARRGH